MTNRRNPEDDRVDAIRLAEVAGCTPEVVAKAEALGVITPTEEDRGGGMSFWSLRAMRESLPALRRFAIAVRREEPNRARIKAATEAGYQVGPGRTEILWPRPAGKASDRP